MTAADSRGMRENGHLHALAVVRPVVDTVQLVTENASFGDLDGTRLEAGDLFDRLVPASGQASTVQGELVRCLFRLHREAMVNGNGNWDDGFRRMHGFMSTQLRSSGGLFSGAQQKQIKADLARTRSGRNPCLDDAVWARLRHAVVLWCRAHAEPIAHTPDPALHR